VRGHRDREHGACENNGRRRWWLHPFVRAHGWERGVHAYLGSMGIASVVGALRLATISYELTHILL